MSEELIFTHSEDGVGLAGVIFQLRSRSHEGLVCIWIHGNFGRFYNIASVTIGRNLGLANYPMISANTRGHDITNLIWKAGKAVAGGSSRELLTESPYDIGGWINFASANGFQRVVLIGHSLGAAKLIYYQAQRHDPRVVGLVLASPGVRSQVSSEQLELAQAMVDRGQGDDLLPPAHGAAIWNRLSAASLLNRHATLPLIYSDAHEQSYLSQLACPILAFYGAREAQAGTGSDTELALLKQWCRASPRVDTQIIAHADHGYAGCEPAIAQVIAQWISSIQGER
ncbi:MAG TPA: DUF1749 domain-containing protein [Herpetosiphon sp.]|uniref:AB hydrolase-1 domain-containing protein n=1 Tax=Herpetosiphon aurantiacus (strain ATCC 23779 / DSM 785 / 114-95) TaxID=316274 RepID=A9B4Q4_HERA2|nr:DUF1749 domain-containing protein [Herpetosiphon sp.]ABX04219.1 conserved hypothetical protein [Herpetosiphon aurantiacus DSM 785]HBW51370.1 DUF1749 domain-containing protein [Herpetosiphon sp.]